MQKFYFKLLLVGTFILVLASSFFFIFSPKVLAQRGSSSNNTSVADKLIVETIGCTVESPTNIILGGIYSNNLQNRRVNTYFEYKIGDSDFNGKKVEKTVKYAPKASSPQSNEFYQSPGSVIASTVYYFRAVAYFQDDPNAVKFYGDPLTCDSGTIIFVNQNENSGSGSGLSSGLSGSGTGTDAQNQSSGSNINSSTSYSSSTVSQNQNQGSGSNINLKPATDFSAFIKAETAASQLISADASESTKPGDHTVGSLDALKKVQVSAASKIDTYSSQADIDQQVSILNKAIDAYNASVISSDLPNDNDISSFTLAGVQGTINQDPKGANSTISVSVPVDTDITKISPTIVTKDSKATISPIPDIPKNFSTPRPYTVTAQNQSIQIYTVTVTKTNIIVPSTLQQQSSSQQSLPAIPGSSIKGGGIVPDCPPAGCDWDTLMKLVNSVVHFILFVLAIPIAAIMFAYAGFELLTSGGEVSKKTKAKKIFTNVAIGLVLACASWLIINTILQILGYTGKW